MMKDELALCVHIYIYIHTHVIARLLQGPPPSTRAAILALVAPEFFLPSIESFWASSKLPLAGGTIIRLDSDLTTPATEMWLEHQSSGSPVSVPTQRRIQKR